MNLYKYYSDCGRAGELTGMFLALPQEVKAIVGKEIYFGEVLGKHSEVQGEIEADEITLVTDNQEFLNMARKLNVNLATGLNPLDYYVCDECGERMDILINECEECEKDN